MKEISSCPSCGSSYGRKDILQNPEDNAIIDHEPAFSQLRTGYVPTDAEKASTLSTIQSQRATVRVIKEELGRMKLVIEQLEARRSDLELQISYQSGLLAPIRQLPDELLAEIMLFSTRGRVDVCSPRSDVWNIGKVCKRWQTVAFSTQEIWSSIDVFLVYLTTYTTHTDIAGVSVATVIRLLNQCLKRSGHRSLAIRFMEICPTDLFKKIFNHLSRFCHRWETLSFSLSMLRGPPYFESGLTRLRYLSLSGSYKGVTQLDSFQQAQLLSQLHLFSVTKPFRSLALPWSQLTHFKAASCEFRTGEFLEMLRHMPNLVQLGSKWNKGLIKNNPNPAQPIHFRSLKSFEIEALTSEIPVVFQPLTMPSLSELYIHTQPSGRLTAVSMYIHVANFTVSVIRRSLCSITTLSLFFVDSTCVSTILEAVPNLKTLYIGYISGVETILEELSRAESLVPVLESFGLSCKRDQGIFSVDPLMELVRNRRRLSTGCFRSLDLTLKEEKGVESIAQSLKPLTDEYGIAIVIHALPI